MSDFSTALRRNPDGVSVLEPRDRELGGRDRLRALAAARFLDQDGQHGWLRVAPDGALVFSDCRDARSYVIRFTEHGRTLSVSTGGFVISSEHLEPAESAFSFSVLPWALQQVRVDAIRRDVCFGASTRWYSAPVIVDAWEGTPQRSLLDVALPGTVGDVLVDVSGSRAEFVIDGRVLRLIERRVVVEALSQALAVPPGRLCGDLRRFHAQVARECLAALA